MALDLLPEPLSFSLQIQFDLIQIDLHRIKGIMKSKEGVSLLPGLLSRNDRPAGRCKIWTPMIARPAKTMWPHLAIFVCPGPCYKVSPDHD